MNSRLRLSALISAVTVLLLSVSGCDLSLRSLPYPGPARGQAITVTGEFANALNLPISARVKWQGVAIGEVTKISVKDATARVTMKVSAHNTIPTNVRAEIRMSSPMGESYVELLPPDQPADTHLTTSSVIPLEATTAAPDTNSLLATAAMVINGGVFTDLNTIITELNVAMSGNTGLVKAMFRRLDHSLTQLNQRTADFDRALSSIDAAVADPSAVTAAVDDLPTLQQAIDVLTQEQPKITRLAAELRTMGVTTTALLRRNRSDIVALFRSVGPVLDVLTKNAPVFGPLLENLSAVAQGTGKAKSGYYNNFDLNGIIDLGVLGTSKHVDGRSAIEEWSR